VFAIIQSTIMASGVSLEFLPQETRADEILARELLPGEGISRTGVRELVQAAFRLGDDALKGLFLAPVATREGGKWGLVSFSYLGSLRPSK